MSLEDGFVMKRTMQDVTEDVTEGVNVLVEAVRKPRFDVGRMKDEVDSRQYMKQKKIMLLGNENENENEEDVRRW